MKLFDLSQPLFDGCPHCPAHPPVKLPLIADHPTEGWRVELIQIASHTATHLDAPLHRLAGGKSIDQIPLEHFTGRPRVADFTGSQPKRAIHGADLASRLKGRLAGKIVLLNTGWGLRRAHTQEWLQDSPYLSPNGAEWLIHQRIRGVGIDHYSIAGSREPDNARTHEILLGAGIWVVEELRFGPGWKRAAARGTFQALPLLMPGFSGGPCRAVLLY